MFPLGLNSTQWLWLSLIGMGLPILSSLLVHSQSSNLQETTEDAGTEWQVIERWDAWIQCEGGKIRFGLLLEQNAHATKAYLVNGPERIEVPKVTLSDKGVLLDMPHYDSVLDLRSTSKESLIGTWRKRRGLEQILEMPAGAEPSATRSLHSIASEPLKEKISGRWQVQFESSQEPAVGVFKVNGNRVLGTFLTTTGDYRFLDGRIEPTMTKESIAASVQGNLILSCFDGAHAFLFQAKLDAEGKLQGDFWSSNTWHETWTAIKNSDAQLPDAFQQTTATELSDLSRYQFPDLDGKLTALDDPRFSGKARIIYVFGSWCPNCHDAAKYFSQLEKDYGDKGLSILGLAFELTGDLKRDSDQVRKYLERQGCNYPVLIAGLADKEEASQAFPLLDRIRSYPTTIFLDQDDRIVAIHTGFSGPATGEDHQQLKQKFQLIIQQLLAK